MGQAQKKDSRPQIIRELNVDHWGSITQALADDLTSDFWETKVRIFFFIRNTSWDFGKLYCGRWRKSRLGKRYWEPYTQREIGAELGLQETHVSRALKELRRHVFVDDAGRLGPRPVPLPPEEADLPNLVSFFDDVLYLQHANFVKAKYEARKAELLAPIEAQKADILASWKKEYEAEMEAVKLQFQKNPEEAAPAGAQEPPAPEKQLTKNGKFSEPSPLDSKSPTYQKWSGKLTKSGQSNKELRQERQAGGTVVGQSSSVLRTVPENGNGKSRPTEHKPAPKPATAPAAPAARYPEQDLQIIRESIRQYVQPFELKNQNGAPLNPDEDHQIVAAVLNAGHLYGANSFQIAAYLYERFKYVLRNRRNAPQGAGWFATVVENHFRESAAPTPEPRETPRPVPVPPHRELEPAAAEWSQGLVSGMAQKVGKL